MRKTMSNFLVDHLQTLFKQRCIKAPLKGLPILLSYAMTPV